MIPITKEHFLANPNDAIFYAQEYDSIASGTKSAQLNNLFNDMEVLTSNGGDIAAALSKSKKWAMSESAQNIKLYKLNAAILFGLCGNTGGWKNTPATQDIEVLKLHNNYAATSLSYQHPSADEIFKHKWDQTAAAQNIEVLSLAGGDVAYNLANSSSDWTLSPAAKDVAVLILKGWEVALKLCYKKEWLDKQCTPDVFSALLASPFTVDDDDFEVVSNRERVILRIAANKTELALLPEFIAFLKESKNSCFASEMIRATVIDINMHVDPQTSGSVAFANSSASFSSELVSNMRFPRHHQIVFSGDADNESENPLFNAIMVKQIKHMPDAAFNEQELKLALTNLMRFSISGCAHLIDETTIQEMTIVEMNACHEVFIKAGAELSTVNKEGELLASISASLFFERLAEVVPICDVLRQSHEQKANELLDEFSTEDLTYLSEIKCGAISEAIAKGIMHRYIGISVTDESSDNTINWY